MSSKSLDDSLLHLVMQLNRQLVKQLAVEGLPVDQWRLLSMLDSAPDGLSMGNICEGLGMQPPSATKLVDKMVVDALVYRVPNPNDRRNVIILASEKGRGLFEQTTGRVGRYEDRLSEEFEPKDVAKLQHMLGALLSGRK
ncbi:MarR family winged helix-turn-helix transcriptional regulator [Pseudogemmobacter sonorensis]|uniref:MarR family winged helix-turn-helix transcriptional regulator n=1 Tax=Pseudogemmobacter sonorensis TaxID=2989681 RepID=UPI0036D10633